MSNLQLFIIMNIKYLSTAISFMVLTSAAAVAQQSDDFKPGGKLFGMLFANYHTTFEGVENNAAFEVTRSFLGFDYLFSEKISTRIMYDGTTQVINGKTIYSAYLRNAYLQYDYGRVLVRGGLIGIEQISVTEQIWGYRFLARPPIDYSGMIQVADLGVMTKFTAGDKVAFDLAIINGRGFKDLASNGTVRLTAGATLMPVENVIIRGYYDLMGPTGRMQRTASIIAAWTGPEFTAGAEYLRQDNHLMIEGDNYSGFSIFTRVRLAERVALFARYDNISSVIPEEETEPWNIDRDGSYLVAGIEFSPVRNIRISPNFLGYFPASEGSDMVTTIGLNIVAKF